MYKYNQFTKNLNSDERSIDTYHNIINVLYTNVYVQTVPLNTNSIWHLSIKERIWWIPCFVFLRYCFTDIRQTVRNSFTIFTASGSNI